MSLRGISAWSGTGTSSPLSAKGGSGFTPSLVSPTAGFAAGMSLRGISETATLSPTAGFGAGMSLRGISAWFGTGTASPITAKGASGFTPSLVGCMMPPLKTKLYKPCRAPGTGIGFGWNSSSAAPLSFCRFCSPPPTGIGFGWNSSSAAPLSFCRFCSSPPTGGTSTGIVSCLTPFIQT